MSELRAELDPRLLCRKGRLQAAASTRSDGYDTEGISDDYISCLRLISCTNYCSYQYYFIVPLNVEQCDEQDYVYLADVNDR